jgi:hypothetical protein
MEESSSPPEEALEAPSPSPGETLRAGFASFDAASFLETQQKQREQTGRIVESYGNLK